MRKILTEKTGAGGRSEEILSERAWQSLIIASTAAVLLFSIYCLSQGITIIFMHLYYFPIVLLGYRYRYRGFALATLISLTYVGLVIAYNSGQTEVITEASYRFIVFIGIAAVVAYFSERFFTTQQSLRETSVIQQSMFQNANVWLMMLDSGGKILLWNKAAEKISGYTANEVIGKNGVWKALYPEKENRKKVTEKITEILRQNNYLENFRTAIVAKDGTQKVILWNTKKIPDEGNGLSRFIAIGVDVTTAVKAEEDMKKSEALLDDVGEMAKVGGWELTVGTKAVRWTKETYRIHEIPEREKFDLTKAILFFDLPERSALEAALKRCMETGQPFDLELPFTTATGRHLWTRAIGHAEKTDGKIMKLTGTFQDITERKQAEETLLQSEERYRTLAEASPDQIFIIGRDDTLTYANTAALKMFRLSYEQVIGKSRKDLFLPDIADAQGILLRKIFETGERVRKEELIKFGTQEFWIDTRLVPLTDEKGNISAVLGVARDITERKQMEESLGQSRQILQNILDTIPVRVFWKDKNLTYLGCNTPFARDAGFQKAEDIIGKDDYAMGWREQAELYRSDDRAVIESRVPKLMIEEPQTTPSGETIHLLTSKLPLYDAHGNVAGVLGTYLDITERKRMDEALRESRQLFSDIIGFLPDATLVVDKDGKVLAWNRAMEQLSGVPAQEIIGKGDYEYGVWMYGTKRPILVDLILHSDEEFIRLHYTKIQREGDTVIAEMNFNRADGRTVALSLVASPLFNGKGEAVGAIESMRDITRLREAENLLLRMNEDLADRVRERTKDLERANLILQQEIDHRKSAEGDLLIANAYNRNLLETSLDPLVTISPEGKITDVNEATVEATGVNRPSLIGSDFSDYFTEPDKAKEGYRKVLDQGFVRDFPLTLRTSSGSPLHVLYNASVYRNAKGEIQGIFAAARDITQIKKAEEVIRTSLEEKIVLLREVHHRVKNNLQILISLLNLQSRYITDPQVIAALKESTQRIRAMSMVHEKLYTERDLAHIEFISYLSSLATSQVAFYQLSPEKVKMEINKKNIMLDINTAIPLGLVMNELVSNALKHAFPGDRKGVIRIDAQEMEDRLEIFFADDGVGVPEGFDYRTTSSLGLRLVNILIEQLSGTITLDRTRAGTAYLISIPKKER